MDWSSMEANLVSVLLNLLFFFILIWHHKCCEPLVVPVTQILLKII